MQYFRDADPQELMNLVVGDPHQMLDLFKSLFAACISASDRQFALETVKHLTSQERSVLSSKEIVTMCPWAAMNATQQTTTQRVTESCNLLWPVWNGLTGVTEKGALVYVKQFWAGAVSGNFSIISQRSIIPLPGSGGTSGPAMGNQIILGPGSQVLDTIADSAMYGGLWGIPAALIPPPLANLPPYTDPSWNANLTLIKPISIQAIGSSGSTTSTGSGVMVRLDSEGQPNKDPPLSDFYTMGRMIGMNGRIGLNAGITSISMSGSGTVSQVQSFRQTNYTQSALQMQSDNKAGQSNGLGSNNNEASGGLRFIQSTQVLEELQPVNYARVSGNSSGGVASGFDVIQLPASGVSGAYLNGTTYQATVPPQASGNTSGTPYTCNNVYDRLTGAFMAGRFYSDRFNINFEYAQSPSLSPQDCLIGDGVCNTFEQQVLSTLNCNRMSKVINKQLQPADETFPPHFHMEWTIAMGSARSMSFGNAVDLWVQTAPDGTASFVSQTSGLGVWGLTGADASNPTFGPTGPIVGGMVNTHRWDHQVKRLPQDNMSTIYKYTYGGTLFLFNSMADAAMTCSVTVTVADLYSVGVAYPGIVARLDGIQSQMQLQLDVQEDWQVVANESQQTTSGGRVLISEPMMNVGFPMLMKALWKETELSIFSNTFTTKTYMERVGSVLALRSPEEMWNYFKMLGILQTDKVQRQLLDIRGGNRQRIAAPIEAKTIEEPEEKVGANGRYQCDEMYGNEPFVRRGRRIDHYGADQMYGNGQYLPQNNNRCGADAMYGENSDDEQPTASGGFWDTVKGIGQAAANTAVNIAGREVQKRLGADEGYIENGQVYLFSGNMNERMTWNVVGRPWFSTHTFTTIHDRTTGESFDMAKAVSQLGLTVVPLSKLKVFLAHQNLVPTGAFSGNFPNIDKLADFEQKYEAEVSGNKKAYRMGITSGWDRGQPTFVDESVIRGTRGPFDYCLVFATIQGKIVLLPSSVVRRALKGLRTKVMYYLQKNRLPPPEVTSFEHQDVLRALESYRKRATRISPDELIGYLPKVLVQTNTLIDMEPTRPMTYHEIEFSDTKPIGPTRKEMKEMFASGKGHAYMKDFNANPYADRLLTTRSARASIVQPAPGPTN